MEWAVEAVEVYRRPELRGVSFGAPARRVTAIVGGDRADRTLLFRIAAGLEALDRGAMLVLGQDMSRMRRRARTKLQRRLGVVFGGAEQALFADGTAWDNVELAVRSAGRVGKDRVEPAVESALDGIGLGHVGGELPASLSPLQRRRLAVARAIVLRPSLVLADGLDDDGDPREAASLCALLRSDCTRRGASAVLFLTDRELAVRAADTVVDLDGEYGAIAQPSTALMRM